MNKLHTLTVTLTLMLPTFVWPTETVEWGNGSVSYSDSIHLALESSTQTLNLSQFNAASIAAQNGGSAADYTLTRVVFAIDGSISGTVEFENESPDAANNVRVRLFDLDDPNETGRSWSRVSYGGYSAVENYSASRTFATVAADSDGTPDWTGDDYVRYDVNATGTGAASTGDITTDLATFIGASALPFAVDFQGNWIAENLPNSSSQISVFGDASVSVTYYYSEVPEPSSVTLLALGGAAVLIRRRRQRPHA